MVRAYMAGACMAGACMAGELVSYLYVCTCLYDSFTHDMTHLHGT